MPKTRPAAARAARTARDHPGAAVEGVGLAAVAMAVLAGIVVVRIARSRRVRRAASASAERGAFGPAVAVATRAARRLHAEDERA